MEVVSPIYKRWQHEAQSDPEAFWARAAREVFWFRTWDRVLDWQPPTFRWFTGATTNLSYNCLDLQVARGNGGRAALIAEHEDGTRRLFTYAQLLGEVKTRRRGAAGVGCPRAATGSRSTCRRCPKRSSRCWRQPGSAQSTWWYLPASAAARWPSDAAWRARAC